MDYATMSMKDVSMLDGVKDLPLLARGKFAQALIAEVKGDNDRAGVLLNEACDAETKAHTVV